uniref:AlNc14C332G10702 protein n=1 Tax=Albugo laibachii Nc14 TaxID=890382 RepID=F0WWT9_9STRA|nr:AlNc14C332G10702 [Albugo laibachii Nc14]|eukprot:CCA25916.1 AlNc14C332G10702 [Albugo laibachii Nc14]
MTEYVAEKVDEKPTPDTWSHLKNRSKCNRSLESFTTLLSRAAPKSLEGLATSNYFDVLEAVDVEFQKIDITTTPNLGQRIRSYHKNHTRIVKDDRPARVGEVVDFLIQDVKTAQSPPRPDTLLQEDVYAPKARKHVGFISNGDKILHFALDHLIALHVVLNDCMRSNDPCLDQVVRVRPIYRVLAAYETNSDTTFSKKWSQQVGGHVSPVRKRMLETVDNWWNASAEVVEWIRVTHALAFFELMLMTIAPAIFHSDHWIQYVTVQPVVWLPAHHFRLLHTNVLLQILRSSLGGLCLSEWFDAKWESPTFAALMKLHSSTHFLTNEASILQLKEEDGVQKLVVGPLSVHC